MDLFDFYNWRMNNMPCKFQVEKEKFEETYGTAKEIKCILPVHLTVDKIETDLYKKDGSHNEQYYKWQFLYALIGSGLCDKDYIGTEVQFPKGNKSSDSIKIDAVIFDDVHWMEHYYAAWRKKDDSRWDEFNWLKEHLLCAFESKKERGKDVKGNFNSQLKAYMNESSKNIVFGIFYDEERLYLFRSDGKTYLRLSDEFNCDNKGRLEPTFDLPDAYKNILSFDAMLHYDSVAVEQDDYSGRAVDQLDVISKTDSIKLEKALYNILHTMDKCGGVNQKSYNLLIQLIALKIYDEKHNAEDLQFYVNPNEVENADDLTDDALQQFLNRMESVRIAASSNYTKILGTNNFDSSNINQIKIAIEIVKEFQNYSFVRSEKGNLYQLVFYRFASQFSKSENAQFVTPLQIIDFVVEMINPKQRESIVDPTVGIADFLSVAYVKSDGKLDDTNIYGMDIDEDMVKLATLNMLLNGDGNATIEVINDGLGSLCSKYASDGSVIKLIPRTDKNINNYNGNWDNRIDKKKLKKYDIVLTNPPFGDARSWVPSGNDRKIAECYETFNRYNSTKIDMGVVFLENAVRILADNGRMAIVLSNSIASIDAHAEARKWLLENMRIVAIVDLPPQVFAEAGVSPTIIFAYKPPKKELEKLIKSNYEIFSREIKKVGYEVKTKKKVKCFEPQYKISYVTFEKELNSDGTPKLDEEFSETVDDFRRWCCKQETGLKRIFLDDEKRD